MHAALQFVPVNAMRRQEVVVLTDVLTEEELARLDAGLAPLVLEDARVGPDHENGVDYDVRDSRVAWLAHGEPSAWLYLAMMRGVQRANLFMGLDVWGFAEPFQYSEYGPGAHYCWHKDSGISQDEAPRPPRKISFTLQLSRPDEYSGGELEFLLDTRFTASRGRGDMILFPSHCPHRVNFVDAGLRRSLVGWACGPEFR